MHKIDTSCVGASVSKWRMTNFGSTKIQSLMLFGQRRLLLSCYSGSASSSPRQARNELVSFACSPTQATCALHFMHYKLFVDFVDFDPDTPIAATHWCPMRRTWRASSGTSTCRPPGPTSKSSAGKKRPAATACSGAADGGR